MAVKNVKDAAVEFDNGMIVSPGTIKMGKIEIKRDGLVPISSTTVKNVYQMYGSGLDESDAVKLTVIFFDGHYSADKTTGYLKSISDSAQKAMLKAKTAELESYLQEYNSNSSDEVKTLAKRMIAAQTELDAVLTDVDATIAEIMEKFELKRLGSVVFLPDAKRFWIDHEVYAKRGGGSRGTPKKKVWEWKPVITTAKTKYGRKIEGKATATGLNTETGEATWSVELKCVGFDKSKWDDGKTPEIPTKVYKGSSDSKLATATMKIYRQLLKDTYNEQAPVVKGSWSAAQLAMSEFWGLDEITVNNDESDSETDSND